ncbi:hypothetical protein [Bacillus infantis]|jgi:hypothetical protein|uniref:hypothetical protein n=1 Tax=Bacillus infantis TaxID=324767 RepID=UPI002155AD77|nr:hypothetical protein [Bacillus infantis]MCR6613366.1 hypothetical protein [Bacillus infantis]
MTSRRHVLFNLTIIIVPWLSMLFIDKRSFKRYSLAGAIIGIFEILNHIYGHQKKFWKFYDKPKSFIRDELPFDLGPYMPVSLWILKFSYGNFKKFILLNTLFHAIFTWIFMPFLKKIKIIRLDRISYLQFFFYIHYKAYLLYAVQHLVEKMRYSR